MPKETSVWTVSLNEPISILFPMPIFKAKATFLMTLSMSIFKRVQVKLNNI